MVYPCNVDLSVEIYNECNYYKIVFTAGDDAGRVDYIPKASAVLQLTNNNDLWIRDNDHTVILKYSEVSNIIPAGHTTISQLLNILSAWSCTNDSNTSSTRISTCINLFNAQFRYDMQPILFTSLLTSTDFNNGIGGSGFTGTLTHDVNGSAVILNTYYPGLDPIIPFFPYPSNQHVIYQSKPYMPYQADSIITITIGAIIRTALVVNHNIARLGYYDDVNDKDIAADIGGSGVFFQINDAGVVSVGRRSFDSGSQVDTLVAQSLWNIDKLDGLGTSGHTLNIIKTQIFYFDIEMNAGRIRYGFIIKGVVVFVHQILVANTLSEATLFNYSLPIRAELINSSPGGSGIIQGASQMEIFSTSVDLCGNSNSIVPSYPFNYTRHSLIDCPTIVKQSGDHRPVISIRLKPIYSRATIWPKRIDIDGETGSIVLWRLILNPTGMTPTWTDVSTKSFAQYSTNDNNVTIGADSIVIASGYMSTLMSSDIHDLFSTYGLHASISGINTDVLTLSVEYVKGSSHVRGVLTWQETK
jgi:hypothetical protein